MSLTLSTIVAQKSEIQELKSRVLNLKKRLRIALEDVKKKESYILYLEQELINLEDEINRLKTRIHEICSHRNILEDNTDMTQRPPQPPAIEIRQNYEDIQKHLGDVRLYFQNRIQVPFTHIETLETNKVLRDELNSEVNINILNEKKIRKYLYELEQCNKTISFQDSTIVAQKSEIQELKSRVLNLKKRLRIALEDVKKKESYILYLEQELINLEDEINRLKTRIHEICSHRNILEDNTDMTQRPPQPPAIEIRQNYEDIQKHLGDVRLYFQNRIQVPFSRDAILKKLELISTSANRLQEIAQNNQPIDQRITQL
ncbi:hypothetical protein Glove_482g12 [Diversispora epigaea]|uniref:Uncharacterized protein n=1 Tax=Diversispora epigaea TaxID=1348612 RepID=A0A397GNT7_9GLOM|nr:hypothetical protein Glove_482g12 [Diversispora epigaea]